MTKLRSRLLCITTTHVLNGASEIVGQKTVRFSVQRTTHIAHDSSQMQTFNIFLGCEKVKHRTQNLMAADILNKSLEGTINLLFAITCLEMGLPVP